MINYYSVSKEKGNCANKKESSMFCLKKKWNHSMVVVID